MGHRISKYQQRAPPAKAKASSSLEVRPLDETVACEQTEKTERTLDNNRALNTLKPPSPTKLHRIPRKLTAFTHTKSASSQLKRKRIDVLKTKTKTKQKKHQANLLVSLKRCTADDRYHSSSVDSQVNSDKPTSISAESGEENSLNGFGDVGQRRSEQKPVETETEADAHQRNHRIDQLRSAGSVVITIRMLKMENNNNHLLSRSDNDTQLELNGQTMDECGDHKLNVQNNNNDGGLTMLRMDEMKNNDRNDNASVVKCDDEMRGSDMNESKADRSSDGLNALVNNLQIYQSDKPYSNLLSKDNSICDKNSVTNRNQQTFHASDVTLTTIDGAKPTTMSSTTPTNLSRLLNMPAAAPAAKSQSIEVARCDAIASKLIDTVSPYPHHIPIGSLHHECECEYLLRGQLVAQFSFVFLSLSFTYFTLATFQWISCALIFAYSTFINETKTQFVYSESLLPRIIASRRVRKFVSHLLMSAGECVRAHRSTSMATRAVARAESTDTCVSANTQAACGQWSLFPEMRGNY